MVFIEIPVSANHHIHLLARHGQVGGEGVGVELVIRIHKEDPLPLGVVEAYVAGFAHPSVGGGEDMCAWLVLEAFLGDGERVVLAAVIDEEEFPVSEGLRKDGVEGVLEVSLCVVAGHDDGEERRFSIHGGKDSAF